MSNDEKKIIDEEVQIKVPLIYELSKEGRRAYELPPLDVPEKKIEDLIPSSFLRSKKARLPEVDTLAVVRHFTNLSRRNIGVDTSFYPLGSCTMKYNPKVNEYVASFPGFCKLHPYQSENTVQGMLEVFYSLQEYLKEIAGLHSVSLMPSAGAHGELTSLMVIKAYHQSQGRNPDIVLIPDSAHGTNPASCTICGYQVKTLKSCSKGYLEISDLEANLSDRVAALMITNPNTLGLFESKIQEITRKVHDAGALVYMDGANMNALLGVAKPGSFGIDVMHYNMHKTFSTPHGGGGPGAGPIAVAEKLSPFLPGPLVAKTQDGHYFLQETTNSIGKTRSFLGSTGILLRAYTYIRKMGKEGLGQVGKMAVLSANYILSQLKPFYKVAVDRVCMHECVLSATMQKEENKVRALDIAKRLLDMGYHAPTIYFPLIVPEALMIEPTETENKETLDAFIQAMKDIAQESKEEPWKLQEAPFYTPVSRLDEVQAARQPVLKYSFPEKN